MNDTRKDESNNFESNVNSKSISKQENTNGEINKDNIINNNNISSKSASEKIQLNEEDNKKDINNDDNIENLNVIS